MRGNESFAFILPMNSLSDGLPSAVQRRQATPALFSESLLHHDFSVVRVSDLNSQCLQPRTSDPCLFHSHDDE
jgi:hypothetical protein